MTLIPFRPRPTEEALREDGVDEHRFDVGERLLGHLMVMWFLLLALLLRSLWG